MSARIPKPGHENAGAARDRSRIQHNVDGVRQELELDVSTVAAGLISNALAIAAVQVTQAGTDGVVAGKLTAPVSPAQGDLLQFDGANWVRLPRGSVGQILVRTGGGSLGWVTPVINIF